MKRNKYSTIRGIYEQNREESGFSFYCSKNQNLDYIVLGERSERVWITEYMQYAERDENINNI